MAQLRVPRPRGGRPRTTPEVLPADKAYSSRAIRTELRRRGIRAVIPQPADQSAHRKRLGQRGGRPPAFDREAYRHFGTIHGDANVGNALRDEHGRALLIDLDGACLAQREWDLILTALYYDRFGWHARSEYESFVHHYGFDIMNWPGYPVLADLRELMMTLSLGQQVTQMSAAAE